jgi:chromosome segregation ATPase
MNNDKNFKSAYDSDYSENSHNNSNLYEKNFVKQSNKNHKQETYLDDDYENDQEREEMENDYQLVKKLTEYKEKNKKLESIIKFQKSKIDTLEEELDNALSEVRVRDMELEDLKNKGKTPNNEYKKTLSQINNISQQLEKYKNMYNDKKIEYNGLLDKYNELQKSINNTESNEKKLKSELLSKDKQIARLIEEIDKKNTPLSNKPISTISDKEVERLNNEVKKLEKQKNDLYVAFKKSLKLCSILKRQKIHLENARLLNFTEDEFKYLIEQNKI